MTDDALAYRFRGHRFDPATGDLARPDGTVERLRPQAAQVLHLLLEASGGLVTREELQERLWPDTVVEFDQGLNACIREIRRALGDSAAEPRFVETLPRRGYRFLSTVEAEGRGATDAPAPPAASAAGASIRRWAPWAGVALLAVVVLVAALRGPSAGGDADPAAPGRLRVLVLPLSSAGSDPVMDTLAGLLTDRLIGDLSRLAPDRLGVIARASALQYAARPPAIREVGRELGLDHVVEGSVVGGDGPAVEIRIVDPRDATQWWAGRWPVEPAGVSGTADRIGAALAGALDPRLADAHRALVARRAGDSPTRDALARVEWLLARHTMDDTERALALLEPALEADPDHPALLEALAEIRYRFGDEEAARDAAHRALARDRGSPEAHRVLGRLAQRAMAWDTARTHLERAVRLAPASSSARTSLAVLLNYLGEGEAAVAEMEAALSLDPVSATLAADAGVVFLWAGRFDGAERHCGAAIELDPEARAARRCLVQVAHLTGRPEVGAEAARDLLRFGGAPAPGPPDAAALEAYWRWRVQAAEEDGCGPVVRAQGLVALGQTDRAVQALLGLPEARRSCLLEVATSPMYAPVRADPGVRARLATLGLPGR